MGMPKGRKIEGGYATVSKDEDALDYRRISEKMTEDGFKMNHATARNNFLRAMETMAVGLSEYAGESPDADEIKRIAKDPVFQGAMKEILSEVYSSQDEIE